MQNIQILARKGFDFWKVTVLTSAKMIAIMCLQGSGKHSADVGHMRQELKLSHGAVSF